MASKKKGTANKEITSELVQENENFKSSLKSINNILIAHKDAEEMRDYRRVFYSVFFMFCILFLLGVLGLCYVQNSYFQTLSQVNQFHQDELENMEFVVENKLREEIFQEKIDNLDLDTDSSVTKYVDPDVSFNTLGYIPNNLVAVGGEYVTDSKGYIQVHAIAKEKFDLLAEQFYNETQQEMVVVSGYRSYAYQQGIKDRGCPDNLCAKAGHSEHQSGYAIDLYSASTQAEWLGSNTLRKYFDWLNANAHVYGFHNPYQNGVEIDGYEPEPWHWRYVGEDLARYLKQNDLTFGQFYYARQEK